MDEPGAGALSPLPSPGGKAPRSRGKRKRGAESSSNDGASARGASKQGPPKIKRRRGSGAAARLQVDGGLSEAGSTASDSESDADRRHGRKAASHNPGSARSPARGDAGLRAARARDSAGHSGAEDSGGAKSNDDEPEPTSSDDDEDAAALLTWPGAEGGASSSSAARSSAASSSAASSSAAASAAGADDCDEQLAVNARLKAEAQKQGFATVTALLRSSYALADKTLVVYSRHQQTFSKALEAKGFDADELDVVPMADALEIAEGLFEVAVQASKTGSPSNIKTLQAAVGLMYLEQNVSHRNPFKTDLMVRMGKALRSWTKRFDVAKTARRPLKMEEFMKIVSWGWEQASMSTLYDSLWYARNVAFASLLYRTGQRAITVANAVLDNLYVEADSGSPCSTTPRWRWVPAPRAQRWRW
jgi:hypothetical protein